MAAPVILAPDKLTVSVGLEYAVDSIMPEVTPLECVTLIFLPT